MSGYHHKHDNDKQAQGQLQGQLQGQGQGQGQLQGQGQFQLAAQAVYSESENTNDNWNLNGNLNVNKNEIDNEIDNDIENEIENKVETDVEVKVEVEAIAKAHSEPTTDIDLKTEVEDIFVGKIDGLQFLNPDTVFQDVRGDGDDTAFNVDQINNMVDNDYLHSASVSFTASGDLCCDEKDYVKSYGGHGKDDDSGSGALFSQSAEADGGEAKIDDTTSTIDDQLGNTEALATATADGIASNEAFTQNIVMGANLQFNQLDSQISGDALEGI